MQYVVSQTLFGDYFDACRDLPEDSHDLEWCYDDLEEAKAKFEDIKFCFQEFRRVMPGQYLSTMIFSFDDGVYDDIDFVVSDSLGKCCFCRSNDFLFLEMEPEEDD